MKNNVQILRGDQTRCRENFLQGRSQMLMCNLFEVADLVFIALLLGRVTGRASGL